MNNKKNNQKDELESWETEVPEFIPTRHELLLLVKHWYLDYLDIEWNRFRYGEILIPDDCRDWSFLERIRQIEKLLGEEEVEKTIDEAQKSFGRTLDPRYWGVFLHGDEEQRAAVRPKDSEAREGERWLKLQEDLDAELCRESAGVAPRQTAKQFER